MNTNITPEALERAVEKFGSVYFRDWAQRAEDGPGGPAEYYRERFRPALLAALPELLAEQPDKLHQHLLDMLGAKDHVDAGRIIGELHAKAAQPASSAGGQEPVGEAPVSALPPMPKCKDRQPDATPGYMESALDWVRDSDNCDAADWLIDNHAAIRAALATPVAGEAARVSEALRPLLAKRGVDLTDEDCAEVARINALVNPPAPAAVPVRDEDVTESPAAIYNSYTLARMRDAGWTNERLLSRGWAVAVPQPAAPQGVDLGQFRPFVQQERDYLSGRIERCDAIGSADRLAALQAKARDCDRLLALIDSQHQQQESGA